jgi:glycosyltransferase involved in cell wall biosynthesis
MRIAIDTHAIGSRLTGNERYIAALAEALLALDSENEYCLFFSREEARQRWENRAPNLRALPVAQNPLWRLGFDFPRQLRRLRAAVFHYQYTGPLVDVCPGVVTIHDVSFVRHPDFFPPARQLRLRLTVRRAVRAARRIITGSEFSKAELVELFEVPEEKVVVIYHGVGPEFRPLEDPEELARCLARYGLRQPYLLAVGNITRRKNQRLLVRSFGQWLTRHAEAEHMLALIGQEDDYGRAVREEIRRLGLAARVRLTGYAPEEDMPYLYAGAELLLNTSLYEGFGLPLIEAMASGVPVVASRAASFPEVCGDAARLVDPLDPDETAAAIEEILGSRARRTELVRHGLARAREFRWEEAARATLEVYRQAAKS